MKLRESEHKRALGDYVFLPEGDSSAEKLIKNSF